MSDTTTESIAGSIAGSDGGFDIGRGEPGRPAGAGVVADAPAAPSPLDRSSAPDRWRPTVAWVATATMLLMVTKGPVYRIRVDNEGLLGARTGDFIDDRWVQAAFVVGALVVVAVCAPAFRTLRTDPPVVVVFAVLSGAVLASSIWSVDPSRSFEQGAMMATGTAAALLAGASLGGLRIVTAIAAATQTGVLVSVFARWREWPLVLDRNGDLAGIYFNRNSLGPVALAAAVSAAALLVIAVRRGRVDLAAPLAVAVVVDLAVWWRSGSLTPVFGLIVAAAAVGLFGLCLPGPTAPARRRVAVVAGSITTVAALGAILFRGAIATRLDRSPTLSGRTEIWDVVVQFVGERPLHGWGFLAAWTESDIVAELGEQYGREVYEAHSGYLEVLLGVGLIGLVATLAVVVLVVWRVGGAAWRRPDTVALFLFGTAVYAVAVNLGETYVGANLLPWTLLAVTAGWAVRTLDESTS